MGMAGSDMGHGAAARWANTSGPLRPVNRGKGERTGGYRPAMNRGKGEMSGR